MEKIAQSIVLPVFYIILVNQISAQYKQRNDVLYVHEIANISYFSKQQPSEKFSQEFIERKISSPVSLNKVETPIVTIPIVIHVLYNKFNELTEEKIKAAIEFLKRDFQLRNENAKQCPERWKYLQTNCQIDFCLADITRKDIGLQSFNKPVYSDIYPHGRNPILWLGGDEAKFSSKGGVDAWDRDKYLNIWLVPKINKIIAGNEDGDFLGYAQYPGGPKETDGVVIEINAFGEGKRTATHEIGHWLNLLHNWNPFCVGDDVDDTPLQKSSYENKCIINDDPITSSCLSDGDMPSNYMTYASDHCMNMFTLGQKKRMHKLFETGGLRYPLLSSKGCGDPLIPDLIIQNEQVTTTAIKQGTVVTVSCKNKNQGKAPAGSSFTAFWLSQDQIFDGAPKDINLNLDLNVPALNSGALSNTISGQITIPLGTSSGTWYIMFGADAINQINEGTKETNNQIFVPITVSSNIPVQTNTTTIKASKDPNCVENNTGDYCFQNNTKLDLEVKFISSPSKKWSYTSPYSCTLQPGQKQSFFDVPAGAARYEIKTPATINGYSSTNTPPSTPKSYFAEGSLYVDKCQENTFFINLETPSYSSNIPSQTNESQTSKDSNCKEKYTGDYCFQNTTGIDLEVRFNSSPNKNAGSYTSPYSCTLQPGQTQCFFNVPAGAARYEIRTLAGISINGYGSTGKPGVPKTYFAEGSLYVESCRGIFFIIK